MNPIRRQLIRAGIAELLRSIKPMLYPEQRLAVDLKIIVVPAPTQSEFDQVIDEMDRARQIVRLRTENDGVKTKLSEVGEAEL